MEKRFWRWLWMALIPLGILLNGCGGGGGGETGGFPGITRQRSLILNVVQAGTTQKVSGAQVRYLLGDGSSILFREVVSAPTNLQTQIALRDAQIISPNVQIGDYFISDLPVAATLQGIWVQAPAGYFPFVVRYQDPFRSENPRVKQMPETLQAHPCLLLTGSRTKATEFPIGTTSLGRVEVYLTTTPPPPADDTCP